MWWSESPEWGRRPVLVLTRDAVADRLSSVLVALITTVHRDIPTEVRLDGNDGLPRACVVNLDSVATVSTAFLIEPITRLGRDRMGEVCQALARATGC
ncbi:MAG TPA: type II toxin-antitoxin system PemK/MazF family toxin [Acidimicrobiales bacterium]|nr:type II toxin-antitoxin system PemK/MazF family toxin [Acidimicrobiales bacterium]